MDQKRYCVAAQPVPPDWIPVRSYNKYALTALFTKNCKVTEREIPLK